MKLDKGYTDMMWRAAQREGYLRGEPTLYVFADLLATDIRAQAYTDIATRLHDTGAHVTAKRVRDWKEREQ